MNRKALDDGPRDNGSQDVSSSRRKTVQGRGLLRPHSSLGLQRQQADRMRFDVTECWRYTLPSILERELSCRGGSLERQVLCFGMWWFQ